jgi:hypothetical protein
MSKTLSKTLGLGLPALAEMIRAKGRGKDTILAHITPKEAALLKKRGGRGSTNPDTGLLEYGEDDMQFDVPDYETEQQAIQNFPDLYPTNPDFGQSLDTVFNSESSGGPYSRDIAYTQNVEDYESNPEWQRLYNPGNERVALQGEPEAGSLTTQNVSPAGRTVIDNQGNPVFIPATKPGEIGYGGVIGAQAPSSADIARQYVEQDTEQQSRDEANILASAVSAAKASGKDSDYSNLLSQLLRLGLGAGTAYALTKGVAQPAAKKAEDQAQQAKNERTAIAAPYQGIGKGLIAGAQAGNLSASNIQAVKAARAMAAQNISRTGGVGVLQGANSIADLEARLLDNQLIQGIKIANIGDNYAVGAIQAGMAADNALAASQADFAKQLGVLLAPMVLGYSPNLPSGTPGTGIRQSTGALDAIANAGGDLLNQGGNYVNSLSTQKGEV